MMPGDVFTITYTIEVVNAGPSSASGVLITDSLPAGATFVSASNGGDTVNAANIVEWLPALTMAANDTVTYTGTAVIEAGTGWVTSMTMDIAASGTIEVTSTGFWQEIRPLAGSAELNAGVPMPVTYVIHIETTTVDG